MFTLLEQSILPTMSGRCCSPIRELRRWPGGRPIQSNQSVHPKHCISARKLKSNRLDDDPEVRSNARLVLLRPVDSRRSSHEPQVVRRCVAAVVQVLKHENKLRKCYPLILEVFLQFSSATMPQNWAFWPKVTTFQVSQLFERLPMSHWMHFLPSNVHCNGTNGGECQWHV